MTKTKLYSVLTIAILFITAMTLPHARAVEATDFKVSGFGTLAVTRADNDKLGLRDTVARDGYFDEWRFSQYSRLGLQLDYAPTTGRIKAGAQIVAREREFTESSSDAIRWAYVDFSLNPSFYVRLGRVSQDNYLISAYREVGYALPWAHAPAEFYGPLTSRYKDGIQFRYQRFLGDGLLMAKVGASKSKAGTMNSASEDLLKFNKNYDLSIEWENLNWRFIVNTSQARISADSSARRAAQNFLTQAVGLGWTGIAPYIDDFDLDGTWIRYYSAGASYQNNGWQVQSEFNYINTESALFDHINSGYVIVSKRLNNFTPFVMFSKAENNQFTLPEAPPWLTAVRQTFQEGVDVNGLDQQTLSLGLRWDVHKNAAIKAQWDRTWMKPRGSYLYEILEPQNDDETINQFTLSVDVVF